MRFPFWRFRRRREELSEEIEAHLTLAQREEMESGRTRKEARLAARREFGNPGLTAEVTRDAWGWRWLADVIQDVRFGIRMLAKSPGFAAVAILTLALGIGANTAIFSAIDAVMLESLPVRNPQELQLLRWSARQPPKIRETASYGDCDTGLGGFGGTDFDSCSFSKPFLEEVRSQGVFSGLAEFAAAGRLNVSGNGPASLAEAQYVSGDFFPTLGVRAAAGHLFAPADDKPSASPVVALSYGYWQKAFGGDPAVVGKSIRLNNSAFTIVGVAESRFSGLSPGFGYDLWVPVAQRRLLDRLWTPTSEDAGALWLVAVGRLRPGGTRSAAQAKLNLLFVNEGLHGAKPMFTAEGMPALKLLPAQSGLTGARTWLAQPLYLLMLGVAIVLLIVCANVAGLLLARSTARHKEIAVRLTLGARPARIVRQLLTESLTLAIAGGMLGMVLAFWGAQALLAFLTSASPRPLPFAAEIDWRVLGFTVGASLLTGILFGLAPAWRSVRLDLNPALKEGGDRVPSAGRLARWRLNLGNSLVVAQVALTVVVLVGAGLLVRTLQNLKNIDPGFATSNVLNFGIDPTLTGYRGERLALFYRDLRERFSSIPGVVSVSYSECTLLSRFLLMSSFHLPGTPPDAHSEADYLPVGPQFFETMKIPLLRGRTFLPQEYTQAAKAKANPKPQSEPLPAIVNQAFVRSYFPKGNPLGQPFGANGPGMGGDPEQPPEPGWVIVGIVRDAKYNELRREINPTMYVPAGEGGLFELRTASNPAALIPAVRDALRQTGSDIPIFEIKTESQQIDDLLFQERMVARLSVLFGALALLLACIGLYGLLSYEVLRRTREIGIRMTLGAQAASLLRTVIGQGIMLAAAGAAIGAGVSIAVTRYLGTLLYDVRASDPLTLAAVAVLLLLVAVVACYMPASRAARVDPLLALRHE